MMNQQTVIYNAFAKYMLTLLLSVSCFNAFAYIYIGNNGSSSNNNTPLQSGKLSANCLPPSTSEDLDINNVKALIHTGGDMWWDLQQQAKYEIPKGSGKTSLFAGSLWLGGVDVSNQLKVAANRFRGNGIDFWTGPLRTDNSETSADVCQLYDRFFKITKQEVQEFVAWQNAGAFDQGNNTTTQQDNFPGYAVPQSIQEWPGNYSGPNANNYDFNLAPYVDLNGNGVYDWQNGDYPAYDLTGGAECNTEDLNQVYGDQTLWWVFNDNGNIHTESGSSQAIGMEIRAQAFAFATNDEVNNMTFYNYQLINRSTFTLTDAYFGFFVDPDLGGFQDDYVGCDVSRGLGFCYNGDDYDDNAGGALGYLDKPPAIGVDFFQGPFQDADGIDNDWGTGFNQAVEGNGVGYSDGIADNERFGMRRFLYFNNAGGGINNDPATASDYYNFMRGLWKNSTPMVHGGDGTIGGCPTADFSCNPTAFMFPGNSDTQNWGTGQSEALWTEVTAGNTSGDRRFTQSAGPFTLAPGAKNYITAGVVWAQAVTGGAEASVLALIEADQKTQAAFDNCFQILEGPYAPELTFQELDQELVVFISNPASSNNANEAYNRKDPTIQAPDSILLTSLATGTVDTNGYTYVYDNTYTYELDSMLMIDTVIVSIDPTPPADTVLYYDSNYVVTLDSTLQSNVIVDSFPNLTPGIATQNTYIQLSNADKEAYTNYKFQGYKVYQVKNPSVSVVDLNDADLARLVFQCDIQDNIIEVINYEFDQTIQQSVPKLKVDGENLGISHSFQLTTDEFATGNNTLVNHKEVYYMAVAYAVNNSEYTEYDPTDPTKLDGQKLPYIESGKAADGAGVKVFTAIPHKVEVESDGLIQNSNYGDEVELTKLEGRGNGNREIRLTQETENAIMSGAPWLVESVTYQEGYTPVSIKVVDPLNVPSGDFVFKILEEDSVQNFDLQDATWELTFNGTDTQIVYTSDLAIQIGNEQLLPDVGLSIYIQQQEKTVDGLQDNEDLNYLNGLIGGSIEFSDPNNQWLSAVIDEDGTSTGTNWIRSGTSDVEDDPQTTDFNESTLSDHYTGSTTKSWVDPEQIYENILGGSWAPFKLCAIEPEGPVPSIPTSLTFASNAHLLNNPIEFLNNVDIVFTSDKSKWTRCPVFEMQRDPSVAQNGANKGFLRRSPSLDKNGNPYDISGLTGNWWENVSSSTDENAANYIGGYGMSWFPGYAIDQETGERLNMAFGEDSWFFSENGNDMIWNPTSKLTEGPFNEPRLGGKHFIYVFRNNVVEERKVQEVSIINANNFSINKDRQMPHYDAGAYIFNKLSSIETLSINSAVNSVEFKSVFKAATWCNFPLLSPGYELRSMADGIVPSDVRVRLRVRKPYGNHKTTTNLFDVGDQLPQNAGYYVLRGPVIYDSITYNHGSYFDGVSGTSFALPTSGNTNDYDNVDNVALVENYGRPLYTFNTDKYATLLSDNPTAVDGLDIINVVPNPYYAYSEYEQDRLDNRIKITNLPINCTVSIYTSSGVLVRTLTKDDPSVTSLQWDLKNNANITVSSGIYIIHVEAPGIGERIIKWFGMMRPIDLDSF